MKTEFYKTLGVKGLNSRFKQAAINGYLHIVEHFLTSRELQHNVDIHFDNDYTFRVACKKGYLEMVRFLLTSDKLSEHVDIHTQQELGLKKACEFGHLEVIQYLLFSPELTEHANPYANESIFQVATKEATMLLLSFKLEKELPLSNNNTRKHKI